MVTAVPNAWNALSGTVITRTGTDIVLKIVQLPTDIDVYLDDISITNCSLDNFRCACTAHC